MPFEQLRALVVSLIEPDELAALDLMDDDDGGRGADDHSDNDRANQRELDGVPELDPAAEFDTRPTNCVPRLSRASTLDALIASLRASPPPVAIAPRVRRRN